MNRRMKVYLAILGVLILGGIAHAIDTAIMHRSLEVEALAQVEEIRARANSSDEKSRLEITYSIIPGRKYGVVGPRTGKVTVYTYNPIEIPDEELTVNMMGEKIRPHPLQGIELIYGQTADAWGVEESIACSSEQCETEGRSLFAANGIEIPQDSHDH